MRTHIRTEKIKANRWQWAVINLDTREPAASGYCKTQTAAKSDAQAWIDHVENGEARREGRVVKGDIVHILPEWQDKGDDQFTFVAVETQLKGMREIRIKATHKATGEPSIGTQSIMVDMLSSHPRANQH